MQRGEILMEINNRFDLRRPPKMNSNPDKRNRQKFCRFHNDHGHDTNECRALRDEIETLIREGHLQGYVLRAGRQENTKARERSPRKEHQAVIETISRGLAAGGETTSGRKHYVREARQGPYPRMRVPDKREEITFTTKDLEGVLLLHDDSLMVSTTIGNCLVKRLMVDTGSSAEVLFPDAHQKMGLDRSRLRPMKGSLGDFI